jgi:hypothetical protein
MQTKRLFTLYKDFTWPLIKIRSNDKTRWRIPECYSDWLRAENFFEIQYQKVKYSEKMKYSASNILLSLSGWATNHLGGNSFFPPVSPSSYSI